MPFGIGIKEVRPKGRDLQLYSNAYVFANGALLTQESSVTIEKKSNNIARFTLGKGFAGMSLGAGIVEVTIDNAVPSADFEFNPDYYLKSGRHIEVGVVMASRQSVFNGFITEATYSHSTNDSSKLSFHLMCRLEQFE